MGIKMAAARSPRHNHPEAITNILVRIIEKTPTGGATVEGLEEACEEVKGSFPSRKTIYRALERLELLFDPLARIKRVNRNRKSCCQREEVKDYLKKALNGYSSAGADK